VRIAELLDSIEYVWPTLSCDELLRGCTLMTLLKTQQGGVPKTVTIDIAKDNVIYV